MRPPQCCLFVTQLIWKRLKCGEGYLLTRNPRHSQSARWSIWSHVINNGCQSKNAKFMKPHTNNFFFACLRTQAHGAVKSWCSGMFASAESWELKWVYLLSYLSQAKLNFHLTSWTRWEKPGSYSISWVQWFRYKPFINQLVKIDWAFSHFGWLWNYRETVVSVCLLDVLHEPV